MFRSKFEIEFAGEDFEFRSHNDVHKNVTYNDNELIFRGNKGQLVRLFTSGSSYQRKFFLQTHSCFFHDFVIRFTIRDDGSPLFFNGKQYVHEGQNICHESVGGTIQGIFNQKPFKIELNFLSDIPGFTVFNYVRDEPTGIWVLHLRIKPEKDSIEHFHLRFLSRFYTGNLICNMTLSRIFGRLIYKIMPSLLDVRERTGGGRVQLTGFKAFGDAVKIMVSLDE